MKIFHSLKICFTIVLFAFYSLPSLAQIISVTAGTDSTVNVIGGEQFADPNDGNNGGLGGDCSETNNNAPNNYPNCNCITLTTLTAPAGQQVSVTFSEFRVFGNFDWLAIFDGIAAVTANNSSGSVNNPSSTDPLLWNSSVDGDEFIDLFNRGAVSLSSTNGSLTFASRFSTVVNRCGWVADVSLCEGDGCPQPLGPAPSSAFVTIWEVDDNDVISIPLKSGTYNFDYAWEHLSDTVSISGTHTNADGDFTTNFEKAGTYRLSITGQFPHLKGYPVGKLLDVPQWGDIQWADMGNMFQNWQGEGFSATDAPDLSQATNMRQMFFGASNFNESLNHWNVSSITNLGQVFQSASNFNGNISNWDVSNVTFFFRAFDSAKKFNQNISGWDVSSVNNMDEMFDGASAFNQAIGSWDVSNVGNFNRMLANLTAFDQPLGDWKFKANANFSQFSSGSNNMSCQNYSSTILGWNFNNPTIENLNLGGFRADYDSTASRARNELIGRGWSMSAGTDIGGDCGTLYSFACTDTLTLGPDTLYGNLSLQAEKLITLDSIVIDTDSKIECTAGGSIVMLPGFKVKTGSNYEAKIGTIDCSGNSTDSSPANSISTLENATTERDLEIAEEKRLLTIKSKGAKVKNEESTINK